MASIPLEWRLSVKGSNEVKTVLQDLDVAFKRGQISGSDYNNSLSQLNRTSLQSINSGRYQNNIYLAQFPNILKISRALSTVTSITRGLLTLSNALNISKIQGNQVDESMFEHQKKANAAMRRYRDLVAQGKGNTDEARLALEEYNTEMALTNQRIQDLKDSNFNEWFSMITGTIFSAATAWIALKGHLKDIVSGFNTIKSLIPNIFPALARSLTVFFTNPALTQGLPFFVAQFLDLDSRMRALKLAFSDWLHSLGTLDATWLDEAVPRFFNEDIPLAIGQAGLALTQFFLTDLPTWGTMGMDLLKNVFVTAWNAIVTGTNLAINGIISGIESLANSFVIIINRMLSAYNNFAKKVGLPKATLLAGVSLPRVNIPLIPAAKGFDGMVNSPTMFLAGEAGPEQVSITPNGKSSGSNTVIINVAGSVITEKKLAYMVDQYQKQNLKSRGFTGW